MNASSTTRCVLGPANLADIEFVAMQMRIDERIQWCANTGREAYEPFLCARTLAFQDGPQYTLLDPAGVVIGVGGFVPVRPRVYQTWAASVVGSWGLHWRDITRHCRAQIDAMLASGEAQRIETIALSTRPMAHAWYAKGLRQKFEGTLRRYFSDGSDAVVYARTTED